MTRIFTEGAEFGDTLFWDISAGNVSASTTQKRSGSYSYYTSASTFGKTITAVDEFYLRFGLYMSSVATQILITLRNSTTSLGTLRTTSTGNRFQLYIGGTLADTGDIALVAATWYLVELHVKIADSGGILEIKVDGVPDATTGSTDTQPGAETTVDNILFGYAASSAYFDDLALNDVAGGSDDSWCGEGKIIYMPPNANGDNSEFTNSSGTSTNNYSFVDDIPSDSDVSYVQASSSGTLDLYNLSPCGLSDVTITRVWAEARAKDTVAEGGQIFLAVKTEGTEYDSSAIDLLTSYAPCIGTIHTVNPNTSLAWTTTQLDALQVGPKAI